MSVDKELGIAEMVALTGLSADTLRWYEREGILPTVGRGSSGRRRYGPQERDLVLLLTSLRNTGMSTAMMKAFVQLLMEGAASHGRRIDLLEQARELLEERRRKLDQARSALDDKIEHYSELIAAGLDCDGAPVTSDIRILQAARG
jgi:DNA-binding transcriptional MerR regulator